MRGIALVFFVAVGCTGGLHRKGDRQVVITADYSHPIEGRSLGFDGQGRAPNGGINGGVQWFVTDRIALGARTGYRYYDQRTGATSAWEVEMTLRHFFFEIGKLSCGFEMTGGGSLATRDLPPDGTRANWIWGYGVVFDYPLSDNSDLIFGYQWHHLSNGGGGDNPDNPTQNDNRFFIGVAWDW